jgi:hypothetical protein
MKDSDLAEMSYRILEVPGSSQEDPWEQNLLKRMMKLNYKYPPIGLISGSPPWFGGRVGMLARCVIQSLSRSLDYGPTQQEEDSSDDITRRAFR